MNHHKIAILAYVAWAFIATIIGCLFAVVEHIKIILGLYWAVITVTTIGYGDVTPQNNQGRILAVILAVAGIPMYSLTVAMFTSWLLQGHINRSEERFKEHVSK